MQHLPLLLLLTQPWQAAGSCGGSPCVVVAPNHVCPPGTVQPDCHPEYHPRGSYPSRNETIEPTRMINVKTDYNATGDGTTGR
jgi:hypothetical protein